MHKPVFDLLHHRSMHRMSVYESLEMKSNTQKSWKRIYHTIYISINYQFYFCQPRVEFFYFFKTVGWSSFLFFIIIIFWLTENVVYRTRIITKQPKMKNENDRKDEQAANKTKKNKIHREIKLKNGFGNNDDNKICKANNSGIEYQIARSVGKRKRKRVRVRVRVEGESHIEIIIKIINFSFLRFVVVSKVWWETEQRHATTIKRYGFLNKTKEMKKKISCMRYLDQHSKIIYIFKYGCNLWYRSMAISFVYLFVLFLFSHLFISILFSSFLTWCSGMRTSITYVHPIYAYSNMSYNYLKIHILLPEINRTCMWDTGSEYPGPMLN